VTRTGDETGSEKGEDSRVERRGSGKHQNSTFRGRPWSVLVRELLSVYYSVDAEEA
jgi:hypothetical protein